MPALPPQGDEYKRETAIWCGLFAALLVIGLWLPDFHLSDASRHNEMALLRLLIELFTVSVSVLVVATAWHTLDRDNLATANVVIFGFTLVAGLDVLETLTYPGMLDLFSNLSSEHRTFFRLAGRVVEAPVLVAIALGTRLPFTRLFWLFMALLSIAALGWMGIAHLGLLPSLAGATPFKIAIEYGLSAAYLLIAGLLWRHAGHGEQARLRLLAAAALIVALGEIQLTPYLTPPNLIVTGPFFKIGAFLLIARSIYIASMRLPYESLSRSEAAMQEREAELRAMIDSLPFPAWARDAKARLILENPAFIKHWGMLLGTVPEDAHVSPAVVTRWKENNARALAGEVVRRESEYTVDNELHTYDTIIGPVRHAGRITGVVGVNIDVTARKRAQEALATSEALLRTFIKHVPAAVSMLDREMRFLYVSDEWFRTFELEGQPVIGRTVQEVFPDNPEHVRESERRVLAGEFQHGDEDPIQRKDGRVDWIQWEMRPWRKPDGSIGGRIMFTQLITQRVEAQKEIARLNADLEERVRERTAELARVNAELEEFSASVSHDLRSPLRSIGGFLKLLQEEVARLGEDGRRHVGAIQRETARASRLIEDLLNLARIGRAELKLQPVDLNALLREALEDVADEARERNIEWHIGQLPTALADEGLLKQVFLNLASNALKFTLGRDPAVIQISLAPAELRPDECVIFVRDNGVGFDMNHADRLFGTFQRLHAEKDFKGTGIGLANVKRIVQRHGGAVWAESSPGQGACFYFSIPLRAPRA